MSKTDSGLPTMRIFDFNGRMSEAKKPDGIFFVISDYF